MKPSSHASLRVDRETVARLLGDSAILQAVFAVGEAVHKLHQTDAVAEKLLEELAELLSADRGAILLNEPVAWKPARFEIVRDVHTRATREGEAIMIGLPTSVLCVPLRIFDLNLGAIYIESLRQNAFTERDLHMLAAIASTVALKFEDTDYIERMRNENEWLRDMAKPEHELLGNAAASYRGSKTRHGNELITRTVAEHNGNVAAAARQIGVSESYIYRVLRQSNGDNSHS